jgi:hypothetical protein
MAASHSRWVSISPVVAVILSVARYQTRAKVQALHVDGQHRCCCAAFRLVRLRRQLFLFTDIFNFLWCDDKLHTVLHLVTVSAALLNLHGFVFMWDIIVNDPHA